MPRVTAMNEAKPLSKLPAASRTLVTQAVAATEAGDRAANGTPGTPLQYLRETVRDLASTAPGQRARCEALLSGAAA